MLISSESEMIALGERIGRSITEPTIIELISDVGGGKTTLTRGIAKGLGVQEAVTSPSFTISKEYSGAQFRLVHYDFYRLPDPGIMLDDLADNINCGDAVVVVEWAGEASGILPKGHRVIEIKYIDENHREVNIL